MRFLCIIFSTIIFYSCDPSRIFEQNKSIHEQSWPIDSTLSFSFEIMDTSSNYRIYYNIRNTADYAFYNLYLSYYLLYKNDTLDTHLQELILMDSQTGEPYGTGSGNIYEHQLTAFEDYHFTKPGKYKFVFKQYMRENPLNGIVSMGIKIEKE